MEETNARSDRHNERVDAASAQDPISGEHIIFQKKKDFCSDKLSRLDTLLSSMGYIDDNAQYGYLIDEAIEKGLMDQFTISLKTFGRWKDKLRSNKPVSKNKGTRSSWNFLSTLIKELESGATSKVEQLTEVGADVDTDVGTDVAQDSETLVDSAIIQTVVEEGVRPEENTGDMYLGLNHWRKEWGILEKPEESFVPKRIKKMIDTFCQKCIEDVEFGSEWGEGMPVIKLSDVEAAGCSYSGHPIIEYTDCRKFIGNNIPTKEASWHHRYSGSVVDCEKNLIYDEVLRDIPPEIIPSKTETKESMMAKLAECKHLDVLWNHFPNKTDCPLTSWSSSRQPARRTESLVVKMPYVYKSKLHPGEEEGDGESVIKLFVYPINECPTKLWPNKPMKNKEYGQLLKVWSVAWALCTDYTRRHPPNACQVLYYHKVLGKYMGYHKDNFGSSAIKRLCDGNAPFVDGATVGGCENSQVIGSSVIIFTRGNCPMKMVFKYASLEHPVDQARSSYVTSPSYQMRMEDGWITVMDPVDDLLMLHSVVFDEDDGQPDDYRIAWVYRNLEVSKDFYVETSTIRRDKRMMRTVERNVDLVGNLRRNIFC